jgi:protocatechuate 3,4-dioxygenase beta subunit
MKNFYLFIFSFAISFCSCSQKSNHSNTNNKAAKNEIRAGGRCEDCSAIYDCPVAFGQLNETDTLPDFNEPGPKIKISGTIYHADGKTPAPDIVLYIYHTDQQGLYTKKKSADGRHGYIKGWVKTNEDGFYTFYTLVPASYPNSNNPRHIHPIIKEKGISEYWIDEFVFDNDPLLGDKERMSSNKVGGSGLLNPELKDGILQATRNIILGMNVIDYPKQSK